MERKCWNPKCSHNAIFEMAVITEDEQAIIRHYFCSTECYLIFHEQHWQKKWTSRINFCRSCKAPIVWMLTSNGKKMPVDANSVIARDEPAFARFYEPKAGHISHFATCPQSKEWRQNEKT
jgi:hypothetical protein